MSLRETGAGDWRGHRGRCGSRDPGMTVTATMKIIRRTGLHPAVYWRTQKFCARVPLQRQVCIWSPGVAWASGMSRQKPVLLETRV